MKKCDVDRKKMLDVIEMLNFRGSFPTATPENALWVHFEIKFYSYKEAQ